MRSFPENISIKGHLHASVIRRWKTWGSNRECGKGICSQEPSPIYSTSQKLLPCVSFFPVAAAVVLLTGSITSRLSDFDSLFLFFLSHILDYRTIHSQTLNYSPITYQSTNFLAFVALTSLTASCLPTCGSHFSSQGIVCYLQSQLHHSLQISHLLPCHLPFTLTSLHFSYSLFQLGHLPWKIVPLFKAPFKCSLLYRASNPVIISPFLSYSIINCESVCFPWLEHMCIKVCDHVLPIIPLIF